MIEHQMRTKKGAMFCPLGPPHCVACARARRKMIEESAALVFRLRMPNGKPVPKERIAEAS